MLSDGPTAPLAFLPSVDHVPFACKVDILEVSKRMCWHAQQLAERLRHTSKLERVVGLALSLDARILMDLRISSMVAQGWVWWRARAYNRG